MKVAQRNLQGLTIGVPKEVTEGEGRVAMTPPHVVKLIKAGASVKIESGSGDIAGFPDSTFTAAGAEITSADEVWKSKVVAKVRSITMILTLVMLYCTAWHASQLQFECTHRN